MVDEKRRHLAVDAEPLRKALAQTGGLAFSDTGGHGWTREGELAGRL
jgi:hypothetical protein